MSNLTYVTYQTFPANTANSMQSIAMIKNFVRNGVTWYISIDQKIAVKI